MKKRKIQATTITAMIFMLVMFTGTLFAQGQMQAHKGKGEGPGQACQHAPKAELKGPFGHYESIPGITDKQKEDIKVIRIALLKDMQANRNLINEKEAKLMTLRGADKPDVAAIDKLIDEISALQSTNRKRVEKARQQIREQLTEEQRLWFDQRCAKQKDMGHKCEAPQGKKEAPCRK